MFGSEVGNINDISLINDNLLHNRHNHQRQFILLIFSLSLFFVQKNEGRSLFLVRCVRVCVCVLDGVRVTDTVRKREKSDEIDCR